MLIVETIAKIRRAYLIQGKSIKQICRELRVSPNTVRKVVRSGATEFSYDRSRQPRPKIDPWRPELDEMLAENVRHRRVHYVLRRDEWEVNLKKVYRIYRELGLQLRNKTPKRRVKAKPRDDRAQAVGPNDVWAMDFVHDQLATGRKLRVLAVVDTFSRYVPVIDPRFSYRGEDVVTTLDRVCRQIGYQKTIRATTAASLCLATWISGPTSVV